jgi:hypothetical protein
MTMKQLPARWNALLVVLSLATMLGCQGLSSANKASKPSSNQQNTKPGQLTVAPTSISFNNVKVGNNQSQPATMTNSGGSSLTVNTVTASGTGFSVSGLSLPLTLGANQSQAFTVIFAPRTAGTSKGNLAIANSGSTNTVDVPLSGGSQTDGALTANPLSLNFGSVLVGSNQTLSETLTNSGGSSLTVTQATPTGTGFSVSGLSLPLTLGAGQSQTFSVTFAPSATGGSSGNLAIDSSSTPTINIALSGNGLAAGALTPSPSSLGFGNVQVGNKQQLSETLTNSGGSNVNISQATISGTGFSMNGLNPPLVLTPGQRFTFTITFTPPSPGNYSGSVSVVSDASNQNLAIPLAGTGTPVPKGQLSVSPTSIDFGNVTVGTQATRTGTLNASVAAVTVSSGIVKGAAFSLSGLSFPVTIPAGQQVQFSVTFTPSANGAASGSITFTSDASNSPTIESLTGTGVPPTQHDVNLSWNASTSQNVIGYNIYRGVKSGGPYSKINSVLNASTVYTDTSVVDGQTYYYVTTAVDSSNQESANSNQAQAVIPGP